MSSMFCIMLMRQIAMIFIITDNTNKIGTFGYYDKTAHQNIPCCNTDMQLGAI